MIFPLIIGVLTSYAVSKITGAKSMYSSALAGNVMSAFNRPIAEVKLSDIFRKNTDTVMSTKHSAKSRNAFSPPPTRRFCGKPQQTNTSAQYSEAIF